MTQTEHSVLKVCVVWVAKYFAKRRLVQSDELLIMDFLPLLNSSIANVVKCKAYLKTKFK